MHDIEPHFLWRDHYVASEDHHSPFYQREYNEFSYTQKVYNYFIHPQWDEFGSSTLYTKVLYADYSEGYAILEFIGEWNDCLHNDVAILKRNLIDPMLDRGISRFILICENVMNFHGDDECYYEEWHEDIRDRGGWICMINTEQHVYEEMQASRVHDFVNLGPAFNEVIWRPRRPEHFFAAVDARLGTAVRELG